MNSCNFTKLLPATSDAKIWEQNSPCDENRKNIGKLSLCSKHEKQHQNGFFELLNKDTQSIQNNPILSLEHLLKLKETLQS